MRPDPNVKCRRYLRERIGEANGLGAIGTDRHEAKRNAGEPLDHLHVGTRRRWEIDDLPRIGWKCVPTRHRAEHRLGACEIIWIDRRLVELLAVELVRDEHRDLR